MFTEEIAKRSGSTRLGRLNAWCLILGISGWGLAGLFQILSKGPFFFLKFSGISLSVIETAASLLALVFTLISQTLNRVDRESPEAIALDSIQLILSIAVFICPIWVFFYLGATQPKSCTIRSEQILSIEHDLSDSGLAAIHSGVLERGEITGLCARVKTYRLDLLRRLLDTAGIDTTCQPEYVRQIDSLGEDALWVLGRRLNTPDLIAGELNQAIALDDMSAVEAVYRHYNIPKQTQLLRYNSEGRRAVLGNLKNYLEASFAGLDPSVVVQARWPADFLHTNYRNDAIIYVAQ